MHYAKVLITHSHFVAYWTSRLVSLADLLQRKGVELTVVELAATGSPYSFDEGGRRGNGLNWRRLFEEDVRDLTPFRISAALWKTLEEVQPDVVLATAIAFPTGATAVRWSRKRNKVAVIMDNARWSNVPRSRLTTEIKRRIYRNVDAMLTPAPSHVASYVAWNVPSERIFFGLTVTDNDWYARRAALLRQDRQALCRQYNLPQRYFLGIGRQVPAKNWAALIDAYCTYRARSLKAPWGLVLVGEGPERARLEAAAAECGATGVHFHPFCGSEATCIYYATASALVLPSVNETWGNVVNEAMACGLPVLVSNRCGCAETLVEEGKNGWTFGGQDRGELAEVMLRLAQMDEADRCKMEEKSREIIARWPLERFAEGVWAAIDYCKDHPKTRASLLDRLLLMSWKGRYHPV